MTNSLDRWFAPTKPTEYRVFYKNWHDQSDAHWTSENSDCNFRRKLVWTELSIEIEICGQVPDRGRILIPVEQKYSNISLLKSHLQKCIRRQLTVGAVKTAYHLLKMNPTALLRRLTIIMIEDVHLHHSFNTLMWLALAYGSFDKTSDAEEEEAIIENTEGSFPWTYPMVYFLLSVAQFLSTSNYCDDIEASDRTRFRLRNNLLNLKQKINNSSHIDALLSLQSRLDLISAMPSEQQMLSDKIGIWYTRFIGTDGSRALQLYGDPLVWIEVIPDPLKLNEWTLTAVDFHCSAQLIEWTAQKYSHLTKAQIKQAIWEKRSSINTRLRLSGTKPKVDFAVQQVWQTIRRSVDSSSLYVIAHYY